MSIEDEFYSEPKELDYEDYMLSIYEHVADGNKPLLNAIEKAINTLLDNDVSIEVIAYMITNKSLNTWTKHGTGLLYKPSYIAECKKLVNRIPFEDYRNRFKKEYLEPSNY